MKTQIKTLTMVRHGESEANALFRLKLPRQTILEMLPKGRENLENPLSARGKRESKELCKFLFGQGLVFDTFFCSEYLRAQQTFAIAFPQVESYFTDRSLNEVDRDNGENRFTLRKRIEDFLAELDERYPGKNILGVSHSGWISNLYKVLDSRIIKTPAIPNCSVSRFERNPLNSKLEYRWMVDPSKVMADA